MLNLATTSKTECQHINCDGLPFERTKKENMKERATRIKFAQEYLIVIVIASIILLITAAAQLPPDAHSVYDHVEVEIVMIIAAAIGGGALIANHQINNLLRECKALKKTIEVSKLESL
jgi:hypothetical protein